MRQVARIALQVPVLSGLGNGLIGSSFILTPQLHPSQFGNTISEFNQTLFFLCLPIMNRDNPRFAHPQGGAGPTPGAAASEDVACLMQDAADGTSPDTRQQPAQGSLQQPKRPGGALILLSIWGTP